MRRDAGISKRAKAGTAMPNAPSTEWDVNGWGDPSIQGFGHDISIDLGRTIFFKIRTDSTDYRIDIYRMGRYAGLGARLVDTVAPSVPLAQSQPEGLRDPAPAGGPPRAYKASYNRPLETRHYRAVNTVFNAEYPFVRFLEANGYDASYTTGVDSDRRGELIANHRLFLSVGHDEYWSGRQRRNVEAARPGIPSRGARVVALRMEARRVGHSDDSVPGGRRQRQPRSACGGRHRQRVRGGVRDGVR